MQWMANKWQRHTFATRLLVSTHQTAQTTLQTEFKGLRLCDNAGVDLRRTSISRLSSKKASKQDVR
jgi:hypothetical protein